MACDYLAIPASLVPSEEANSEARDNFEDRQRLHSCTFKAEMCIRSWIDLLDSINIPIPQDINDAYESLEINLEEIIAEDDVIEYCTWISDFFWNIMTWDNYDDQFLE